MRPNHARQRTSPCVTAPDSAANLPPATLVPRRTPESFSLARSKEESKKNSMKRSNLPKTNLAQSNLNYVDRTTSRGSTKGSNTRIQKDAREFTEFIERQKKLSEARKTS
jgi:hypothetical protein